MSALPVSSGRGASGTGLADDGASGRSGRSAAADGPFCATRRRSSRRALPNVRGPDGRGSSPEAERGGAPTGPESTSRTAIRLAFSSAQEENRLLRSFSRVFSMTATSSGGSPGTTSAGDGGFSFMIL